MNVVDLVLAVLLLLCAIRGFWRGLIRESVGFAAFLLGLLAALRFADPVGMRLEAVDALSGLPDAAVVGGSFVAIFLAVSAGMNIVGFLFDRLLGRGFLRQASKVGGSLFGVAKGGAVLAFVLLFLHLFPFVRGLDERLEESRLARPMIAAADDLLRGNWKRGGSAEDPV